MDSRDSTSSYIEIEYESYYEKGILEIGCSLCTRSLSTVVQWHALGGLEK